MKNALSEEAATVHASAQQYHCIPRDSGIVLQIRITSALAA
jgi:hypothetical protein